MRILFLFFTLFLGYNLCAQEDIFAKKVSVHWKDVSFSQALDLLSQEVGVSFAYSRGYLPPGTFSLNVEDMPLGTLLDRLLKDSGLSYAFLHSEIILTKTAKQKAQNSWLVRGKVKDAESEEELVGAYIFFKSMGQGGKVERRSTVTNVNGFFAVRLPEGRHEVLIKYLGYGLYAESWEVGKDLRYDVKLLPFSQTLKQVEVRATPDKGDEKEASTLLDAANLLALKADIFEKVPAFFGESDVVRSLQVLPSIQNTPEGSAELSVRGGSDGQNLVLLDGVPVYNPYHMFGLFSIFNTGIVKKVNFYAESFPAQYGGRTASVIDVQTKDGNRKKKEVTASVGVMASHIVAETPWAKGKGTLWAATRFTYIDPLIRLLAKDDAPNRRFYFYDVNLKATWRNKKIGKLSFSTYFGNDESGLQNTIFHTWGNRLFSLQWDKIIGKRWFSKLIIYSSTFERDSKVRFVQSQSYAQKYYFDNNGLKQVFTYYHNGNITFESGLQLEFHDYDFGSVYPLRGSIAKKEETQRRTVAESGLFSEIRYKAFDRLNFRLGLRVNNFSHLGPATRYLYNISTPASPQDFTPHNIIGKKEIPKNKIYDSQSDASVRFSVGCQIGQKNAVKATYSYTNQYLHLLSKREMIPPPTYWVPSNIYLPAQHAKFFSLGFFRSKFLKKFKFSLQGYIRHTGKNLDFKPAADIFMSEHIETELMQGERQSVGVEFMLSKEKGRLTGSLSYTYAQQNQYFDGINEGKTHPTSTDRRHNLSCILSYQINRRLSISANWMLASGLPFSHPGGIYRKDNFILPYYTGRNNARLPTTHRLDFSLTWRHKIKSNWKKYGELNFSVYNLYMRKNVYSYIFRQTSQDYKQFKLQKIFLFPILPSVTYKFKF